MEVEQDKLVKDVFKMVAENEPRDVILAGARKAKISLSAIWSEYQQAINLLDTIVATFTPVSDWQAGWWSPTVSAQQLAPKRPVGIQSISNPQAVLAIAASLKASGQKTIDIKAIMEQLRIQGDQRPDRKMAISIGNILSWSKKWKRVAPGEYEPME